MDNVFYLEFILKKLVFKYGFFALVSTICNLLFQYISFYIYSGYGALYIAMAIGTVVGLIVKYILDKKFIFYHKVENRKEDLKKFTLYSFMGIFTTLIFWGVEMFFYYFIDVPYSQYIGAIIGLSIGYVVKYNLDKKFVFIKKEER